MCNKIYDDVTHFVVCGYIKTEKCKYLEKEKLSFLQIPYLKSIFLEEMTFDKESLQTNDLQYK